VTYSLCRYDSRGVFRSTDNGTNWTQIDSGLTNIDITSLAVTGSNLFAGTYDSASFFPPTREVGLNRSNEYTYLSLAASGNEYLRSSEKAGVFLPPTTDKLDSNRLSSNISIIYSLVVSGTNLLQEFG